METSYLYHATLALISRQIMLSSRREVIAPAIDSLGFLQNYFSVSEYVAVYGSKGGVEKFPSMLSKRAGRIVLLKPDNEYWQTKNCDDYVRGDICFFLAGAPLFEGFLRSYECRAIWNYSTVVNPAIEKWVRLNADGVGSRSVVQHTNRVAGADYFIVKAELPGIIEFCNFMKGGMKFQKWTEQLNPIESAVDDARLNWRGKWFMHDRILARSLELIQRLE